MRIESGNGRYQTALGGFTFTRADTVLRVELAPALIAIGERDDASRHTDDTAPRTGTEDIDSTVGEAASSFSPRPFFDQVIARS